MTRLMARAKPESRFVEFEHVSSKLRFRRIDDFLKHCKLRIATIATTTTCRAVVAKRAAANLCIERHSDAAPVSVNSVRSDGSGRTGTGERRFCSEILESSPK